MGPTKVLKKASTAFLPQYPEVVVGEVFTAVVGGVFLTAVVGGVFAVVDGVVLTAVVGVVGVGAATAVGGGVFFKYIICN
jgi:hypothetical protein